MNIFHKVTLRYLKENRTRTLVTIIGIILSAAMFTGVTTSISSLQDYLLNATMYAEGNWYGGAHGLSAEQMKQLSKDSRTEAFVSMELLGFADLKDSINDDKPYLCVQGIQTNFTEIMPIHLFEGRLPENSREILLPEHLKDNGGIDWAVGDKLSLKLGSRVNNFGDPLTNQDAYHSTDEDSSQSSEDGTRLTEQLISPENHHYTVVGIYERPNYEGYQAPGYTALTIGDNNPSHSYSLYLRTAPGRHAANTIEQMFEEMDGSFAWELNYSLLRIYGYSGESPYNRVLYTLGAILIMIIMFGSICLIYNAFSISVSERTKQFGLLASIGATKRQLVNSVLFESMFLSIIGIPLGMLSGLLGIGITFYFVRDMLANVLGFYGGSYQAARFLAILGPAKNVPLRLHPSFGALAIAVLAAFLTVLISAWLPARRAMKKSAIEAIRQNNDISIRARKVKTSRLTQKLFGFEGALATKNYKRNRRKYRATVISLFLSVVLFISASSFCAYLSVSTGMVLGNKSFDIAYVLEPESGISPDTLLSDLSETESVTASSYAIRMYLYGTIKTSDLDQGLRNYWKHEEGEMENEYHEYDDASTDIMVFFLADKDFKNYLHGLNLSEDAFFDLQNPKAVVNDSLRLYSGTDQKYHQFQALNGGAESELNLYLTRERENYDGGGIYRDENGVAVCDFYHQGPDDEIMTLPREEACLRLPLAVGAVVQQSPAFFPDDDEMIRLFYPYSMLDAVFSGMEDGVSYYGIQDAPLREHTHTELFFQCEDHTSAAADMTKRLQAKGLNTSSLVDYAMSLESDRAMMTVVNIFSYGFITLISLIAAANVFNTISTNINLRRREFAMLKSIGMTPKAFSKMMDFECLLYGFKGLLYGLPVSVFITWMIYRSVGQGLEMRFFIPWYSIAIAVGSVFLVVFITMLYSMKKIQRENTIDTLKNENL